MGVAQFVIIWSTVWYSNCSWSTNKIVFHKFCTGHSECRLSGFRALFCKKRLLTNCAGMPFINFFVALYIFFKYICLFAHLTYIFFICFWFGVSTCHIPMKMFFCSKTLLTNVTIICEFTLMCHHVMLKHGFREKDFIRPKADEEVALW